MCFHMEECLKMGIEPMTCLKNGNRTHEFFLKMGIEPMTCWCCELEQNHCLIILVVNIWEKGVQWNQTNVQEWESNPKNLYMWKSKTFLWVKMVNESRSIGWKWELNPWTCVWHLSNDLLFFIGLLFYIPWSWWWWFSNFDEWQKVPMKLDIVYMDTISLAKSHCIGLWEVYRWTLYQRLTFENMFGGEVYFTRPRKKRNSKSSILY